MAGSIDHILIFLHTCHLYCSTAIDWLTGLCRNGAERIDAVWQHVLLWYRRSVHRNLKCSTPRTAPATGYESHQTLHGHADASDRVLDDGSMHGNGKFFAATIRK
uniref:Secreted protein n=1 Tax=Anopheles dirus TaxID=7168 RepID=A0A182NJZ6_9DIPT